MKVISTLLLSILLISCSQHKQLIREERKLWGFNNWKNDFKDRAFCQCLLEGYNDRNVKKFILKNDKSYYDGIGIAIFDPTLIPIIQKEVTQIKKDSLESVEKVPEHIVGKRIFNHCLNFYKSKKLDSITKSEIHKWKKIKKIQDEVWKEVPTY
ncbi:hypothetical protein ACFQZF_07365 [Flavobacterium myungsuense]|uniref:Lipoprotein n=1 Tax=Flavobacterium myungsuense TaxID=651823 RepID=A0ABW3IYH6_9FLAO